MVYDGLMCMCINVYIFLHSHTHTISPIITLWEIESTLTGIFQLGQKHQAEQMLVLTRVLEMLSAWKIWGDRMAKYTFTTECAAILPSIQQLQVTNEGSQRPSCINPRPV